MIERYIRDYSDPEPLLLQEIEREAYVKLLHGNMVSGYLQGRLLKMFTRMIDPKRVLEVGTYIGYSALSIAEGLSEGGVVHTVEINDELEDIIRKNFSASPHKDKISLHIGGIEQIITHFEDSYFDMAFIDGNKRTYWKDYELVLPKVRSSGIIIVDDTLWHGKILKEIASNDWQTAGIVDFNKRLKDDHRVEKIILPLRDGLTLIYKK